MRTLYHPDYNFLTTHYEVVNEYLGLLDRELNKTPYHGYFYVLNTDEANRSARIIESVRLLRKMHLQAIICAPPDKIPDIVPEADCTLMVRKEGYRILQYGKEIPTEWNEAPF